MAYFVRKHFDKSCFYWLNDLEYNRMFITCVLRDCERILQARGYLFVNDIYEKIGFPLTKEGQIKGWTYENEQTEFRWSIYKIKNENAIGIELYSMKNILYVLPEE